MAIGTLSEQIYHELYHDITTQQLQCGQKLTLKILKDRFGTSHTPIREALMRLAENGLVTYYSNCGVAVTKFTDQDIQDLYNFSAEIDALAVQFCENTYNHIPLITDLQEIVALGDQLLEKGDLLGWKESSERFHSAFYEHARNVYLDQAATRVRAKLELLSWLYYKEQNIHQIHRDHKTILDFVKNEQFKEAADMMRQHLQYDMVYALKAYNAYQSEVLQ